MENLNIERKPLSELVKEADEKKIKIVIIGAGEIGSKVAEVIASEHFMGIHVANLNTADQEMLERANKKDPFAREPIPIKPYDLEAMPKIDFVSDEKKHFAGFRHKKLKGYQKRK